MKPSRRLINNPLDYGGCEWPLLFSMKRPDISRQAFDNFLTNSHTKERQQKFEETQPKPKSCSRDRHLMSSSDRREYTSGFGHIPKS